MNAMKFDNKEDILQLTAHWQGDRFENGRPRVGDDILKRMQHVALEEAWGVLWGNGYKHQFQDEWKVVPEGKTLVGRAVTGVMVPQRPDLHDTLLEYGQKEEARAGFFNSWVIETLVSGDVMVIDMFDKIFQGTYVGGNLANTIAARGGTGQVLWCGIRDVQQVADIDDLVTFYRGNDPTGIGEAPNARSCARLFSSSASTRESTTRIRWTASGVRKSKRTTASGAKLIPPSNSSTWHSKRTRNRPTTRRPPTRRARCYRLFVGACENDCALTSAKPMISQ